MSEIGFRSLHTERFSDTFSNTCCVDIIWFRIKSSTTSVTERVRNRFQLIAFQTFAFTFAFTLTFILRFAFTFTSAFTFTIIYSCYCGSSYSVDMPGCFGLGRTSVYRILWTITRFCESPCARASCLSLDLPRFAKTSQNMEKCVYSSPD